MMRKALFISVLALAGFVFNSCKNDLKILAPYKERISVYAVLNPQENLQLIRINKIYLGEGNAYDMAKVSDSINYAPGVLTVTLERFINGVNVPTTQGNSTKMQIVLKDTMVQTAAGSFNTNQMMYTTNDRLYPSGTYKMTIKDNHTSNTFTAQTVVIDSVKASSALQPLAGPYWPVPFSSSPAPGSYVDYSLPTVLHTIRFYSIPGARQYSPIVRFHYADTLVGDPVLKPHYVDVNFANMTSQTLDGGEQLSFILYSSDIYSALDGVLSQTTPPANLYGRKAIKIDFFIYAGAQDLTDFLQISAPSTSVSQDKPTYSNIDGGYGIFSCKSRFHISKQLDNNWINYMSQNKPT
ncbi:MAG: hypothetical protein ACXVPQ_05700, partial [Bacteroidia bacterium]